MYSRYDPTVHDTFLPVSQEATAKTYDFPAPEHGDALSEERAETAQTATPPQKGGLLDGLKGLLGGASRGRLNDLDLGDVILLLIVALLFLEGGGESDLIILLAVALFVGF